MDDTRAVIAIFFTGLLLVGAARLWWDWNVSGRQAEVWRSQGVEVTQWDVFIGVHPAAPLRLSK